MAWGVKLGDIGQRCVTVDLREKLPSFHVLPLPGLSCIASLSLWTGGTQIGMQD